MRAECVVPILNETVRKVRRCSSHVSRRYHLVSCTHVPYLHMYCKVNTDTWSFNEFIVLLSRHEEPGPDRIVAVHQTTKIKMCNVFSRPGFTVQERR